MKVLQIITSLSTGGAEKLIVDSVPLYQQKGIEMDVLTLKDNDTPFKQTLLENTNGLLAGLTKGSVYNPLLIFRIIPWLRKYDIVHVHLFPALYWVVMTKWIGRSRIKIIYTEHNTTNKRRTHTLLKYIDQLIYKGLNKIACITDQVEYNLKAHVPALSADVFTRIDNGVNISEFVAAQPQDRAIFFADAQVIIIQISSFRQQKDQPTLLNALAQLGEQYKLLLVGDGPLRKQCEELAMQLGVQDRVQFLGIRTDIPELLQTADIVVLSSFHEGLSLASIEGMAVKPFIASDVEGLREIVGGYGLLFEQGNAGELARQIETLANDQDYYNQVKERCALCAQEFDIHKMVEGYVRVYEELTGKA